GDHAPPPRELAPALVPQGCGRRSAVRRSAGLPRLERAAGFQLPHHYRVRRRVPVAERTVAAGHCPGMAEFARLSLPLDTPPMEAKLTDAIPTGEDWQFEPKWDGFRCLAFRDGGLVELMSKSGKPLGRYFPEVGEALRQLDEPRFVLDGELVLPVGDVLSSAGLRCRRPRAACPTETLAPSTPRPLLLSDCLPPGRQDLRAQPLSARRAALEGFTESAAGPRLLLSPVPRTRKVAEQWFAHT